MPRDFHGAPVEAQLIKNSGMDIGYIMRVFDGVVANFISSSMNCASLDASSCHPDAKPIRMMVSPIGSLGSRGSPEFSGEDHDGILKESALF
jgi:hypothetical protein